MYQGQKEISKS